MVQDKHSRKRKRSKEALSKSITKIGQESGNNKIVIAQENRKLKKENKKKQNELRKLEIQKAKELKKKTKLLKIKLKKESKQKAKELKEKAKDSKKKTVKKKYMEKNINTSLLVITLILLICLVLLITYHANTVQSLRESVEQKKAELDGTYEELLKYKKEYEEALKDLNVYDELYKEQSTELEVSKEAALMEYYFEKDLVENWCVPEVKLEFSDLPELIIIAKGSYAEGWPIMSILIDGKHVQSFEVSSVEYVEFRTGLEMPGKTHYLDIVFNNDYIDRKRDLDRNIRFRSISLDGSKIKRPNGFYDSGKAVRTFDCKKPRKGWWMTRNGALRFKIRKV